MLPKIDSLFIKKQSNNSKKIFPEYDYKLNFDGCSKSNPGLSGCGAVIYNFDKEIWSSHFFVGENATNNHAEYAGLILGLEKAKQLGIKKINVEGDSLLVINQMKGVFNCKSHNLIELHNKAKELESYFDSISYIHVLRNKNKRADELSNNSIKEYLQRLAISDN
jgi:ribonuclease HI